MCCIISLFQTWTNMQPCCCTLIPCLGSQSPWGGCSYIPNMCMGCSKRYKKMEPSRLADMTVKKSCRSKNGLYLYLYFYLAIKSADNVCDWNHKDK